MLCNVHFSCQVQCSAIQCNRISYRTHGVSIVLLYGLAWIAMLLYYNMVIFVYWREWNVLRCDIMQNDAMEFNLIDFHIYNSTYLIEITDVTSKVICSCMYISICSSITPWWCAEPRTRLVAASAFSFYFRLHFHCCFHFSLHACCCLSEFCGFYKTVFLEVFMAVRGRSY